MPDAPSNAMEHLEIDADSEFAKTFVSDMLTQIQTAYNDTTDWRADRQTDYEYENGMRGKQNPDVPFPGAPDIRPRTSLAFKRQWVGDFVAPVVESPNIVKFSGGGAAAQRQQDFWNFVFRSGVRGFRKTVNGAASRFMGPAGNCVVKVTYDYTTHVYTRTEAVPTELKAIVTATDEQINLLETKQQVQISAGELMGQPQPAASSGTEPPSNSGAAGGQQSGAAPPLQQIEQLRQLPLLAVAKRYDYDLDDPTDKERAEKVLKQIRAAKRKDDVVMAVVERAEFPLKYKVIDHCCDILVPPGTLDIQDAPWVAELMLYDERGLRDEEACGKFKNVEDVIGDKERMGATLNQTDGTSSLPVEAQQMRQWRDIVQGLAQNSDTKNMYPVWEVHCWIPRNEIEAFNGSEPSDDASYVRAVIDFSPYASAEHCILRMMAHPYDYEGEYNWPYIQGLFNDMGEGFYSGLGIAALLRPFEQEEIECKSAAVARDIMAAAPLTVWNENLLYGETSTPEERRLPGFNMSCQGDPERLLKVFQMPDLGTPLHADANRNRIAGKEMIGIGDTSQLPNYERPPNRDQVNSVLQPMNSIKLWEMKNFLDMWSDIFRMSFLLMKQYYFLDNKWKSRPFVDEQTDELREILEADFQHDFIIKAGGTPSMVDERQLAAQALSWMQVFGMNPQFAWMVNPTEFGPDISNLMLPAVFSKKWIKKPKDAAAANQQFMQMQAQAMAQAMANKQKRQGASTQAAQPQLPGNNIGTTKMGVT